MRPVAAGPVVRRHLILVTLIRRMTISIESLEAFCCDQKLFAHFSETGAAIFTIEQVQYGGHDHPHRSIFD
ncbi:hypothetical protein ACVWY3_007238 [Bradyrhizobium sp. USDA 4486]